MSMKEFWDQVAQSGTWTSHYEGETNLHTYNFFTRREAVLKMLEGDGTFDRILDVGCGTGDYIQVASRHKGSYFGVDYSWPMINQARQQISGHGKQHLFLVGSGEDLPYQNNCFDLVMAMGYIEYFQEPFVPLREIQRILKPGGILVMQSHKRELFSNLDRFVINPLRSIFRRTSKRTDSQLPPMWVNKQYSQHQLDELLRGFGLVRIDYTFNNFFVFPRFMRRRFPHLYIRLSEVITQLCPRFCGFLAANYIGKYVLEKGGVRC
jgi:ubiquinone/menaquinone biosynthesis C-methylase UbiE